MLYIKLVQKFSTDINWLLDMLNEDILFISGWDKSSQILNSDNKIIEECLRHREHQNTYIMSKDMQETKKQIIKDFSINNHKLEIDCFTIVSNGTSAAFLSLLQMFKEGFKNILFIGPIYFTYYHLVNMFKGKLFYWNINPFCNIKFDFNTLEKEIIENNIECIIITLPLFGTGVSLDTNVLKQLFSICNNTGIYLIIDYVYGGMEWDNFNNLHNYLLTDMVLKSKHCIMYESISKKIFLNGIKSAIIYSNSEIIKNINIDSEICHGGISFAQESLLNTVYECQYKSIIIKTLQEAINHAQNNYKLIKALLIDTDFLICESNSGYFTLIAIPLKYFKNKEDKSIAKEICQKYNILTIPHSRYYFNVPNFYCFRVNLAQETDLLISGIKNLLNICNY